MNSLGVVICLCTFMSQDTSFYEKVLNDHGRYSAFVAVRIKSNKYTGRAIIENVDLYKFYSRTKAYDQSKYRDFLKKSLLAKDSLSLSEASLEKWGFIKVVISSHIEKQATLGAEHFINRYFKGKVFRSRIGTNDRNAVIYKLFEMGVMVKIDDESGYLVISR